MYSVHDTLAGGFPHSEILGSKPVCRLPEAYRRLPRLSSPVAAKASTMCAYSLDHITPSGLLEAIRNWFTPMQHSQTERANNARSINDKCFRICLRLTYLHFPNCKRTICPQRTEDIRPEICRPHVFYLLRLVEPAGIEPATPSLQS